MRVRFAWLAMLMPALAFAACSPSSGASNDDGSDSGGATGGTAGSGGAEAGSGGNQASGGSLSGSGGRGGLMANQCTDAYACGTGATCYEPGATPPSICGAPQWCGECNCPTMLPVPRGDGHACDESIACPETTDAEPNVAGLCDEESGTCTQCLSNAHCSGGAGYCELDIHSGARICFQCQSDADCPEASPFCFTLDSANFGMCRTCKTTADCASGVCSIDGLCLPACQNDTHCGPNEVCGAEQRCVPEPCQSDAECSEQSTCDDQTCQAKSCASDAECPGGYCVDGRCYETPGGCRYDTAG